MRQIGTIADERQVQRLADFLLIQGIRIKVEPGANGFAIWAIDEDRVPQARGEVQRFLQNPDDARYLAAGREARRVRDELIRKEKERSKNVVNVGKRWSVPPGRPVTIVLIVLCCLVGIANDFGERGFDPDTKMPKDDPVTRTLQIASINQNGMYRPVFRPGSDIFRGQIWRLITPIFLHMGPMHLLMNMLALHSLGSLIEIRRGSWRLALMVLLIALVSNLAQYLFVGPSFGGISGVAFGLFGYVWMKSSFDPTAGMYVPQSSVVYMIGFLVLCTTGVVGPIANYAHFGGLIMGMILGYGPVLIRQTFGR